MHDSFQHNSMPGGDTVPTWKVYNGRNIVCQKGYDR